MSIKVIEIGVNYYVSLLFGFFLGGGGWVDTWASVNLHGRVNVTGFSSDKMDVSYLKVNKITSEETLREVDFLKSTCGQVVNVNRCHRKDIKMYIVPAQLVNCQ